LLLIRQAQVSDFPRILDINVTEEEKTSQIDLARIAQLDRWADYHRVAVVDDEVIGFLLVMSEASDYDGDNFRWFVERYNRFLYVDRIVIDRTAARSGIGSALYGDLIQFGATQGCSRLCCEINVLPPNPVSHAFHARFGFREVGRSAETGASKVVSYQLAAL
jgi:predicted GNAT superfamily acetyltransferase